MKVETNAERLELVKSLLEWAEIYSTEKSFDALKHAIEALTDGDHINWIIKQAERARELETINLGQQVVIQSLRNKSTVKIIKERKSRPTVIEWNGDRYTFDPGTTFRGGVRRGKQPHKGQAYKTTLPMG